MKKTLYILLCFTPIVAIAQCYLEPNGVTTDPRNNFDNATNPLHPQFKNRFFDWTLDNFTNIHWAPHLNSATTLNHPHNIPGTLLYNNADFLPENGWELITFNKGYLGFWEDPNGLGMENNDNTSVYYILYNKYRSLLRVYFILNNQLEDYPSFRVNLGLSSHRTAIFASAEKVISPLLEFNPNLQFQAMNRFFGNGTWHYVDFTVMYDPCTCDNTTSLELSINTLDLLKIDLVGHSMGDQEIINTVAGQNSFGAFTGAMKKSEDGLLSGQKYFEDMQSVLRFSDRKIKGSQNNSKVALGLENLNSFLKEDNPGLLHNRAFVGEGLSIFNTFVGTSFTEAVKVPAMAMELNHNFTSFGLVGNRGTLTGVDLPGSNISNLNNFYPIYNEVLGVANVLDKPKIYTTIGLKRAEIAANFVNTVTYMHSNYSIGAVLSDELVNIVINPASNLELVEAFGQFHITFDKNPLVVVLNDSGTVLNNAGFIQTDDKNFISPMVPLSSLSEFPLFLEIASYFDLSKERIPFRKGERIKARMFELAKERFAHKTNLILTLHFKDDLGRSYIHRYTFDSENIFQPIVLEMDKFLVKDDLPPIPFALDGFQPNVYQSRNFSNDPFWGSTNYDWSLSGHDNSYTYENKIIKESRTVKDTMIINGESAVFSNPNNSATELSAGVLIDVNEEVTIGPNSTLQIENHNTKTSSFTYPVASVSKVSSTCNDARYIGRARPFSKTGAMKKENSMDIEGFSIDYFPNPAATQITVNVENLLEETQATISILDLQGRSIYNQQVVFDLYSSGVVLPVSNLPSGIYILQVEQKTGQIHREKLIIQK